MKSFKFQSYGGKSIVLLYLSFLLLYSIPIYTQNTGLTKNKLNTKENFEERDFSFYEKLLEYDNENKQSTDSNLTLLSTFNIGPCFDAVPSGNYLYAGNGPLFQVFDITDPDSPVLIGEVLSQGQVRDIVLYGEYAIFISPFTVVDISDPSNPTIVTTENYYAFRELYISENYAYVGSFTSVKIIDISDPRAPEYLSTAPTYSWVLAIASKENYLYISDGYSINIFNIEDKTNPIWISGNSGGGWGGLIAKDNYLYSAALGRFKIFDITDPSQLKFLNEVVIAGASDDLTIKDNLAFIPLGSKLPRGIAIINISDPFNLPEPLYVDAKNSPLGYVKCKVQNNYAYISTCVGMDIYSIEDPYSPSYLGSNLTSYNFQKLKTINGLLYAMDLGGLKVIDYSDPHNLKIIGEYQQTRVIIDFEINGDYAYLLSENSVEILNIKNIDSIYKINELIIPDPYYYDYYGAILLKDSILIASIPKYQIKFINVKDPYNIFITDSLETSYRVYDLALKGDYLISAEDLDGLKVYKISTPPYLVNHIDTLSTFAVLIENDLLYAYRLIIYDIADPESLIFLGKTHTPGSSSSGEIDKSGQYVILAFNQSLEVIDVSDPYNPFIAAYSRGVSYPSVAAAGNLIFAGHEQMGIKVFQNDLMTPVNDYKNISGPEETIQSYPNPFNTNTIITYKIKNSSFVRINIYDLLGRKIETLENKWMEGGEHKVIFNSKNLASGVYFCSLQIDDEVIKTIKLQLIK